MRLELDSILLALLARNYSKPHSSTLAAFGDRGQLFELARSYHKIAMSRQCQVFLYWFSRYGKDRLRRHQAENAGDFLANPDEKAIGVALGIEGLHSWLRFAPEEGIHTFVSDGKKRACLVETSETPVANYVPPERVEFPDVPAGTARREYNLDKRTAEDSTLVLRLTWSGNTLEPVLAEGMELQLRRAIRGVLDR